MKTFTIFKRDRNQLKNRLFHPVILLILYISLSFWSGCTPFARLEGVIINDRLAQSGEWNGVRITRNGEQLTTTINMDVNKGDDIKTDANSQGVIVVSEAWQVIVLPNSDIKILNPTIFQKIGMVIVNTIKNVKEKFKVETEYVTAAAEGTEFLVEVDDDGVLTITVLDGMVKLESKTASWTPITLQNRTMAIIRGQEQVNPQQITTARVNEIRQWRINAEQVIRPIVPNLRSFRIEEARDSLQNMGFKVREKAKITGKTDAGYIYDQRPNPGARSKVGETVTLYVEAQSVKTPNLVGLHVEEAKRRMKEINLRVGKVTKVPKAQGEAETVIYQSVKEGTLVKPGNRINLQIVKPAAYVPDLKGLHVNEANNRLKEIGLIQGKIRRELRQGTAETVFKQSPTAGSLTPLGNSVDLWLVEPGVIIPKVTYLSYKDAQVKLRESQLMLGKTTYVERENYAEGTVIQQLPSAGSLVKTGSTVDLQITKKPDLCYLPNVKERSRQEAETIVKEAGFSVIIEYASEEGVNVKDQKPGPGYIKCGSRVTLIVRRIN